MNKQELLSHKALYEAHIAYKSETLREFKSKLKSIDRALQELERGDQVGMFEETSMHHDLIANEIDVMAELNG